MERIRDDIKSQTPAPANFVLGPSGERAVYSRASVSSIVLIQQNRVSPLGFTSATFPLADLDVVPGAVGTIAQGRISRRSTFERPTATIPTVGTLAGVPAGADLRHDLLHRVRALRHSAGRRVARHAHVGGGLSPPGHTGYGRDVGVRGIATIAIAAEGYGFGPLGSLRTNFTDGTSLTIPDAGRSYDQDGNNLIATDEGTSAAGDRLWTVGAERHAQADSDRSIAAGARH